MARQMKGQILMQVVGKTGAMGVRHRKRHARLQRLLRAAEDPPTRPLLNRLLSLVRDRHRAAASAKLVLGRQERMLQPLRRDNAESRADLAVTQRRAAAEDGRGEERLGDLLFEYNVINNHNRRLEMELGQLRGDILQVDEEMERCRKLLAKRKQQDKNWGQALAGTEIKAKVATQKYDREINELRALREKTDSLLVTRRRVRNDLAKLKAELDDVSSDIVLEIERSSAKLKGIARANVKSQEFMDYYNSKKTLFEKETSYLDRKNFCSKKLHRFLSEKLKSRGDPRVREKQLREQLLLASQQKNQAYADVLQQVRSLFPPRPDAGLYDELLSRHRNARVKDRMSDRAVRTAAASPLIRAKLGDVKLQEVIKSFIEMMEENFYLFSALSDKQKQLADVSVEYGGLKREEAALRAKQALAEGDSAKHAEEIRRKIVTRTEHIHKVQKEIEEADQTIQDYVTGVLLILRNIGYTEEDIQNVVGPHEKVNERNLGRCIAAVEQFLDKLLLAETYRSFKTLEPRTSLTNDQTDPAAVRLVANTNPKPSSTPPVREMSITPPSLSEDEDEEEHEQLSGEALVLSRCRQRSTRLPPAAEERPLTRDELMKFLQATLFESE